MRLNRTKSVLSTALILLALAQTGKAQDSHYWTQRYGTRATLLGGLVVGSVLDLSGTFYNPGSLSLVDKTETLLAAYTFEYFNITLKNLAGSPININSSHFGPVPSFLAGTIKLSGRGKHWLGYSILTRQQVKYELFGAVVGTRDEIPRTPGQEDIAADFELKEELNETWMGLTWACKIKKNIGLGVSQYVTVRSQSSSYRAGAQALTSAGEIAAAINSRSYKYNDYGLLWKVGLAFDLKQVTLGLTLTTPSLKFYGTGSTKINLTAVGLEGNNDGTKTNDMVVDYQNHLNADYHTPLSLGVGTTFKLKNIQFYGSTEWFAKAKKYTVIDGRDFVAQSSGQALPHIVTAELHSVLNYGLGIEYNSNKNIVLYGSFTTDFSARPQNMETTLSPADWDIYHFTGGSTFSIKRTSLTLGLVYACGSQRTEKAAAFPLQNGNASLPILLGGSKFVYSSLKLIIGFSF
jgi:hypothetical protein